MLRPTILKIKMEFNTVYQLQDDSMDEVPRKDAYYAVLTVPTHLP